jgi:release factor glutamine methyltransferase
MLTIKELLEQATKNLETANIVNARRNASLLLMDLLNCNQTYLIAHSKDIINSDLATKYQNYIKRRLQGEPVQYILGHQEFYGRDFIVNPSVLIPRPETELIIDFVIELVKEQHLSSPQILDVGTGSGCIAITLACEIVQAEITAVDISSKALEVAKENSLKHSVSSRINWVCSDLVKEIQPNKTFDFCCANLPYIAFDEKPTLAIEVRNFEPETALFADENGLALTKKLFEDSVNLVRPKGYLICEIGFGQEKELLKSVNLSYWKIEETLKDLQGIARTIVLRRTN